MFAYIPARGGSQRVPNKNIKLLDGKPVLAHVIDTIRQLDFLKQVYVSTDSPEIVRIAETSGATCLDLRRANLADHRAGFIDLIREDLPRFSAATEGDREVLFVLATAALVPPHVLTDAYTVYEREAPEILMSCERYPVSPYWAMVKKPDGFWQALFPDKVLVNSQDLPETLVDAGLFYFFSLDTMSAYSSVKLVDRLMAYEVDRRYAVDVDTSEDWRELERKFQEITSEG